MTCEIRQICVGIKGPERHLKPGIDPIILENSEATWAR